MNENNEMKTEEQKLSTNGKYRLPNFEPLGISELTNTQLFQLNALVTYGTRMILRYPDCYYHTFPDVSEEGMYELEKIADKVAKELILYVGDLVNNEMDKRNISHLDWWKNEFYNNQDYLHK